MAREDHSEAPGDESSLAPHEAKMELGSVSRMWNQRRREFWVVMYFRTRVP